jgi:hypothetical protein
MFRGRGIGHALAEHAVDALQVHGELDRLGRGATEASLGGIWIVTEMPGYFLPVGFRFGKKAGTPPSLEGDLRPKPTYIPTAMVYTP